MASRALAASAETADDYLEVCTRVLDQADQPVILHWLGDVFDPTLRGYWGSEDFGAAADTVIELIKRADGKIGGIKLSVLDADQEVALRRRLPPGVRMFTGDDFNYADLIRGDATGHSDALLGTFAAIAAPAAAALHALDAGDVAGYDAAMGPTVPLSQLIFAATDLQLQGGGRVPGLAERPAAVFLDAGRDAAAAAPSHLIRVFELAAAAGALTDPECAAARMTEFLSTRPAHA